MRKTNDSVEIGETDYRFYLALCLIGGIVALWMTSIVLYDMNALMTCISATISLPASILSFYFVQVSYEKNQARQESSRDDHIKDVVSDTMEQYLMNIKGLLEQQQKPT